jgi:hypothetical protein
LFLLEFRLPLETSFFTALNFFRLFLFGLLCGLFFFATFLLQFKVKSRPFHV